MTHYFLVDEGGIIQDAIQYDVDGYFAVELDDEHLPPGINGGWYRFDGVTYQFDVELYEAKQVNSSIL